MAWTWRLENASGVVADHPAPTFSSQSDAENWIGESWRELADSGVTQVRLFDGTTEVYGPMPLAEG